MGDLLSLLIIILFIFMLVKFPFLRYSMKHPIKVSKTALYDIKMYFKHKKYNECKEFGKIRMYCAKPLYIHRLCQHWQPLMTYMVYYQIQSTHIRLFPHYMVQGIQY